VVLAVIAGDLRDPESLKGATKGIDVVYNIAALFRPENVTRKEMWRNNVQGTKNMLDAAVKAGVQRFVHCSTVGVHGDIRKPPANEDAPYAPGDYYQESKTAGEKIGQYMAEEATRHFRRAEFMGREYFLKPIKAERFIMLGSGEIIYQMIYIDDLIDGILLCGTREQAVSGLHLDRRGPITLNQLVRVIADVLGVRLAAFSRYTNLHGRFLCEMLFKPLGINPPLYRRRVDFSERRGGSISPRLKMSSVLSRTDLKTGIKLTADWYREQKHQRHMSTFIHRLMCCVDRYVCCTEEAINTGMWCLSSMPTYSALFRACYGPATRSEVCISPVPVRILVRKFDPTTLHISSVNPRRKHSHIPPCYGASLDVASLITIARDYS
jgi:nucleoside-diphosphate-sugar epimerase